MKSLPSNTKIRLASIEDLDGVVDSVLRHLKEPGFHKLPAHPFSKDHEFNRHEIYNEILHGWSIEVGQKSWARTFVIDVNNTIKGYLNIRNYSASFLNKANLGMGLELEIRGRRLGPQILAYALDWVKMNTSLDEISLFVFDHNLPAKTIYKRAGFKIVEKIQSRFQIDGYNIDDIAMKYEIVR